MDGAEIDLYWIPLGAGAGGALVRWSGRTYETLAARRARRARCDLYHSALMVRVDGPVVVGNDPGLARRMLELAPQVPTMVWGRDELETGDMWNSNSLVSWLLARSDVDTTGIGPPTGGRAPGWDAGLVAASREPTATDR